MPKRPERITIWRLLAWVIVILGLYVTVRRYSLGLGAVTALEDNFPWGLWKGFNVLSGVALGAGGFTLAFLVYIIGRVKYHPIIRPAILTALLGYLLVVAGLFYDIGKYYYIWHPIIMWNPHSVLFEVCWCVILYTTVLALEFSPAVFERFNLRVPLKIVQAITIPLVIAGIILSTLHQSSLGSLFLIVPGKLHPLWYSPILPILYFLSAVAVGPAMVILGSNLCSRALKRGLRMDVLSDLARFLQIALVVYVVVRVQDLFARGVADQAFTGSFESVHFLLEMFLFIIPIIILASARARNHHNWLFLASVMVALGVVYNRNNTCITGMLRTSGTSYFPAWSEFMAAILLFTMGVIAYYLAVKYLPVFPEEEAEPPELSPAIESIRVR